VKVKKEPKIQPIASVIFPKVGGQNLSFGQPYNTADGGRRTEIYFFVKIGFSPIKSPNSSRKSILKRYVFFLDRRQTDG
jgi:hypothetical protein